MNLTAKMFQVLDLAVAAAASAAAASIQSLRLLAFYMHFGLHSALAYAYLDTDFSRLNLCGFGAQFTQLDMEMAFMDSEAIMKLAEDLMCAIFKQVSTTMQTTTAKGLSYLLVIHQKHLLAAPGCVQKAPAPLYHNARDPLYHNGGHAHHLTCFSGELALLAQIVHSLLTT